MTVAQIYYNMHPDNRIPDIARQPIVPVSEASMRAALAERDHSVDPWLLCYSDEEDTPYDTSGKPDPVHHHELAAAHKIIILLL